MYEENGRFNWAGLFIKVIIVVIFILFTVWLLSLSTRGLSTSLNVLTDNVFSENIEKMKEVGKSYFTTERLPEKVGEVATLTLDRMYDKKLLLPLKDRNGKTCSASGSYVSIQKMDTEYQMKVYLECPDRTDYIVVIMGCYNYCDADICEKKVENALEYEYKKTANGYWTDWSSWSDWSKTKVTKTDSRDVETKVVKEDYTYDKKITETKVMGDATCPKVSGYTLASNKNGVCSYSKTTTTTSNPECPKVSGYTNTGRSGFTCNYSKTTTKTVNPECPSVSGYTNTGRSGATCSYAKNTSKTVSPVCPNVSGYTNTGRSGFTCNYTQTSTTAVSPVCPSVSGYTNTGMSGFTCNYSTSYQVPVGKKIVSACDGCAKQVQTVYETRYSYTTANATCPSGTPSGNVCVVTSTSNTTRSAQCPSGTPSGSACVVTNVSNTTRSAICPSGVLSGNICVVTGTNTLTRSATCPSGTPSGSTCVVTGTDTITRGAVCTTGTLSGSLCVVTGADTITKDAQCASGTPSGSTCVKKTTSTITKNAVCSNDKQTMKDGKCYENVTTTKKVTEKRDVTYYRYRTRKFVGGEVQYKWSASNSDKSLLNSGYKLTGKTREVTL